MPNLGEELYPAESANLRGAARRWSDLRDVEALLETYDRLGACFADDVDRRRIAPVRRALVAPRRRSAESADALERRAAGFRAELNAAVPGTRDAASTPSCGRRCDCSAGVCSPSAQGAGSALRGLLAGGARRSMTDRWQHEGVTRPYAPARFEYRIWGRSFPELPSPDEEPESREVYLVRAAVDSRNVKLRREALEIKRLLGVRTGLQHWLPALRCALPLPATVIEDHLCPELGVAPSPLRRASYDLGRFLAEVASELPGVRVVSLVKRRRSFEVAGSRAERTRVRIGEVTLESVAIEAERFERAARATDELELRRAPNLDYVTAIRRVLAGQGLVRPDGAQPCG
jgi:hypothetical protein